MKKVKYIYDYPINRDISKHLSSEDKLMIAEKTGYTIRYIRYWCMGTRRNKEIEKYARLLMKVNLSKIKLIDNQPKSEKHESTPSKSDPTINHPGST